MEKVEIESLMKFSDNGEIVCEIRGERMESLERILSIVKENKGNLNELDFFEFGSSHYNLSSMSPRSGKASHLMGICSGLNYRCFDAYNTESDFDIIRESMEAYQAGQKFGPGIIHPNDKRFENVRQEIKRLKEEKDVDDFFVKVRNEEYYHKYFGLYENLDLDLLKRQIGSFSIDNYPEMLELIDSSKNPIIFSQNVLTSPKFSFDLPFTQIKKGFHIHDGSIREIFEILGEDVFHYRYPQYARIEFDREDFLNKFKEKYGLDKNLKVFFENDNFSARFYWNADEN